MVKTLLPCKAFITSTYIKNSFMENYLEFGYKQTKKSVFDSVFSNILYKTSSKFSKSTH